MKVDFALTNVRLRVGETGKERGKKLISVDSVTPNITGIANFWAVVLPWLISVPFYTGQGMGLGNHPFF